MNTPTNTTTFPRPRRAAVQVDLGSSKQFRNALDDLIAQEVIQEHINEVSDRTRFEAQGDVIKDAWENVCALVDAHTQARPARRRVPAVRRSCPAQVAVAPDNAEFAFLADLAAAHSQYARK